MANKRRGPSRKALEHQVCCLEFVNDQLAAEISYVDEVLREIGFADGLKTVKAAAQEIIEHGWSIAEA